MGRKHSLILGVGINDADYKTSLTVNNKTVRCPFYQVWRDMITRGYCKKFQAKYPTYIDCIIHNEWLIFSNFKSWMEQQDWRGKQLDKDLLIRGNKLYSPETCVFITGITNKFLNEKDADRGALPLGVTFNKVSNKFQAQCRNPFTRKNEYLGLFTCPDQAHQAWQKRKHELACQLADMQTNPQVAQVLRTRYL